MTDYWSDKLLLAAASTVIFHSNSCGTCYYLTTGVIHYSFGTENTALPSNGPEVPLLLYVKLLPGRGVYHAVA
jgi:hypothetical protein